MRSKIMATALCSLAIGTPARPTSVRAIGHAGDDTEHGGYASMDLAVSSFLMRRFVVDSNAIDPIADNSGAYESVRAAIDAGRLEILYTHINIDELAAIPDPIVALGLYCSWSTWVS